MIEPLCVVVVVLPVIGTPVNVSGIELSVQPSVTVSELETPAAVVILA
jgi:hypothetical protein